MRWYYSEVINAIDPDHTIKTQGIFSTPPGNGILPIDTWGALRDQIIGTDILLFLILAVTDARNTARLANLAPFIVGLIVVAIGMAWGTNSGYAINPARDFGPRLASWLTGYGVWRDQYGAIYFWVPIIGPSSAASSAQDCMTSSSGVFCPSRTTSRKSAAASLKIPTRQSRHPELAPIGNKMSRSQRSTNCHLGPPEKM